MFFAKIMGVALNGLLAVEMRMARRFESSRLLGGARCGGRLERVVVGGAGRRKGV